MAHWIVTDKYESAGKKMLKFIKLFEGFAYKNKIYAFEFFFVLLFNIFNKLEATLLKTSIN